MSIGLSSLSGTAFLWLYLGLLVAALVASGAIGAWLRPDGDEAGSPSEEELALLSGGKQRFSEMIVARLLGTGALTVEGSQGFRVMRSDAGSSSAERALIRHGGIVTWDGATKAVAPDADAIAERLERKGWLIASGEAWRIRLLQAFPFAVLFVFGLFRQQAGAAEGEPTGLLVALLVLTALIGLWRLFVLDRRSRAGRAVLARARENSDRLRRAPTGQEMGAAVALFGTGILVGTPFAAAHTMRQQNGGEGGGTDTSSGDSGCGGGGCGGCGG